MVDLARSVYGDPTSDLSFSNRIWSILKPSVLSRSASKVGQRPTAYLDGLRGLAALLVYITHHLGTGHNFGSPLQTGFGADGKYSLITLPVLRILFSGSHFAVPLFFVISGNVLSRGPLRMIHAKEGNLGDSLSSAIFRRGIRLWLPVIGTTFTYMIIRHLGIWADWPKLQPTLFAELRAFVKELIAFTYVLRIQENPFVNLNETTFSYNPHTWTIALEYQGSVLLFIVLLSFSRFAPRPRLMLSTLLAIYFVLNGSWVSFCFISGSILAEVDLLELDVLCKPDQPRRLIFYVVLTIGLWLASMPTVELRAQTVQDLARNPGWSILASFVPSSYQDVKPYWLSWGAVMLTTAITFLPWLKNFFETRFLQYLGRISFAFYLGNSSSDARSSSNAIVHGPVLQILAVRLYHITGQQLENMGGWLSKYDNWLPLPSIGPLGLELSFLLPHVIILPVTFYCAELAERIFDMPSVRVARWSYNQLLE